jgi:hypothetical protein
MKPSTFDVKERHKRIIVFKVGKLWLFKQFFEDKEIFKALLGYYNQDNYRFEFKTIADRNNASRSWSGMASTTSWWKIHGAMWSSSPSSLSMRRS